MTEIIASHWIGVYSYDRSNGLPDFYADTEFELSLKLGWFGRFSGSIVDAEPGIPQKASVLGKITRSRINFKKEYACLWMSDDSGALASFPEQPSYVLHYVGDFKENRTRIIGTWEIRAESRWINGVQCFFPPTTGTWTAKSSSKEHD